MVSQHAEVAMSFFPGLIFRRSIQYAYGSKPRIVEKERICFSCDLSPVFSGMFVVVAGGSVYHCDKPLGH